MALQTRAQIDTTISTDFANSTTGDISAQDLREGLTDIADSALFVGDAEIRVIDMTSTAPPGSPGDRDAYVVAATATGAWAGEEDSIAVYDLGATAWVFIAPTDGAAVWNLADGKEYRWDADASPAAWAERVTGGGDLVDLGDVLISGEGAGDVGRPVVLTGVSPTTFGLGFPTINPLGGGLDLIGSKNFSAGAASSWVLTDIDLYDEIILIFEALTAASSTNNVARLKLSTDGGVSFLGASGDYYSFGVFTGGTGFQGDNDEIWNFPAGTVATVLSGMCRLAGMGQANVKTTAQGGGNNSAASWQIRWGWAKTAAVHNALEVTQQNGSNWTSGTIHAYGIKRSSQPTPLALDYTGTPSGAGVLARMVLPYNLLIRSGASGAFKVGANPSGTETVSIRDDGTQIGTISITSGGVATVSIPTDAEVASGSVLDLYVDGARTFTDLYGALQSEQNG